MNAIIVPATKGRKKIASLFSNTSLSFKTNAPRIAGMDKRKAKSKAHSLLRPRNNPAEMQEPEREIPGAMAIPWNNPIIKASRTFRLSFFSLKNRVANNRMPVIRRRRETLKGLSNNLSRGSLNKIPIMTVGMVAIIIKMPIFVSSFLLRVKRDITILLILLNQKTITASNVPK